MEIHRVELLKFLWNQEAFFSGILAGKIPEEEVREPCLEPTFSSTYLVRYLLTYRYLVSWSPRTSALILEEVVISWDSLVLIFATAQPHEASISASNQPTICASKMCQLKQEQDA